MAELKKENEEEKELKKVQKPYDDTVGIVGIAAGPFVAPFVPLFKDMEEHHLKKNKEKIAKGEPTDEDCLTGDVSPALCPY